MATTTSGVYINVIEDVISKIREEFIQSGTDETVLNDLQGLWEMKMMHCGAICGPIERSSAPKQPTAGGVITPVHDLNVPYEGTEEYETPTAEILFPPTPLQTPIQTPLPGTAETSIYQMATPSEYTPAHDTGGSTTDVKPGRPSPYMQPPSPWMNQRPLGVDVNVAYVEGRDELERGTPSQNSTQDFLAINSGKRKRDDYPLYHNSGYLPQQDGAGDYCTFEFFQSEASRGSNSLIGRGQGSADPRELLSKITGASSRLPQQDGPADSYDELYPYQGVANEDYNAVTPASHGIQGGTPAPVPKDGGDDDDDDEPLNENDDDDDLDDVDEEGEEQNSQHLVLAQFDKVSRTKSRWKCILKDGIMHINNKDILFNKATGEFDF